MQIVKYIATTNGYNTRLIDQIKIKIENKNKQTLNTALINDANEKHAKFNYTGPINHKIVFKKYNITTAYYSDNKSINNINTTIKSNTRKENRGVYQIKCQDCDQFYIGMTTRNFEIRKKEHESAIKYNKISTSNFAEHIICEGHKYDSDHGVCIIQTNNDCYKIKALEKFYIYKYKQLINQQVLFEDDNLFKLAQVENKK